jgi:hypothetical protein
MHGDDDHDGEIERGRDQQRNGEDATGQQPPGAK